MLIFQITDNGRVGNILSDYSSLMVMVYMRSPPESLIWLEAQARIGKGWPSRRKASKLKALPRAYTKIGCVRACGSKLALAIIYII